MKQFFNIKTAYKFEWNDLRCLITAINVILIIIFGLSVSWFGLAVAVIGLVKDLTTDRHINSITMHLTSIILNGYFLGLFYNVF